MVPVRIELPSVLADLFDGRSSLEVESDTLTGALQELVRLHPLLRTHLFEDTGRLREHVLCFHNGENSRWFEGGDRSLSQGDEIRILQAVSGG